MSFDVTGLDALAALRRAGAEIAAVLTLPAAPGPLPAGACDLRPAAERAGALVLETRNVDGRRTLRALDDLRADAAFVVGWSRLVRAGFRERFPRGVFGMHPTLLPRHRGRAPIPWAILSGLARTGVTLFRITDDRADAGPVLGEEVVDIDPRETAATLFAKVRRAHVALLDRVLPDLLAGRAAERPQDERRASTWPRRTPADGIIDWCTRAPALDTWVRALTRPYPGAFTWAGDRRLTVWAAEVAADAATGGAAPGTVLESGGGVPVVACGEGALRLLELTWDDGAAEGGAPPTPPGTVLG